MSALICIHYKPRFTIPARPNCAPSGPIEGMPRGFPLPLARGPPRSRLRHEDPRANWEGWACPSEGPKVFTHLAEEPTWVAPKRAAATPPPQRLWQIASHADEGGGRNAMDLGGQRCPRNPLDRPTKSLAFQVGVSWSGRTPLLRVAQDGRCPIILKAARWRFRSPWPDTPTRNAKDLAGRRCPRRACLRPSKSMAFHPPPSSPLWRLRLRASRGRSPRGALRATKPGDCSGPMRLPPARHDRDVRLTRPPLRRPRSARGGCRPWRR
jgi:hypothetical protein